MVVVLLYQDRNRGISFEYSLKKNDSNSYDQSITGNEIERMDRYQPNPYNPQNQYYPSYRSVQYRWWNGEWTTCSKQCNGGQQQRRVLCLKMSLSRSTNATATPAKNELPPNSEIAQDQYCDSARKPATLNHCNTHVCPPVSFVFEIFFQKIVNFELIFSFLIFKQM